MSNETRRILLVEDEKAIRDAVAAYLERENYWVTAVGDGQEALEEFSKHHFDLVVLDLMLPRVPGERVCRAIRDNSDVPIIMLTAKGEVEDRIIGLELGADDYLTKPFHLAELNARIKCIIRRKQQDGEMHINLANIIVYPDRHAVYINEEELVLNRKEFDLLYYFVTNPDRLISKGALAESIWGDYIDQADSFDFIYSQVKNLRKKLKSAGATAEIKAVYGFGYKMVNEE